MKFGLLFASLVTFTSLSVFAQSRCLQQASNDELLNEAASRMGNSSSRSSEIKVSFACVANSEVALSVVDIMDGRALNYKFGVGDFQQCESYANLLNKKLGNQTLTSGKVIALCGGSSQLVKVLVGSQVMVKEISRESTRDWQRCYADADRINLNL